jgi:predicted phosphodiesterase
MPLERIALISDVHGNLTALEAVLADIAARGITRIFNLGDSVGKGPRGAEVVDRVRDVCEVSIRGNWDDFIDRLGDDLQELAWWRDELSPEQRAWLAAQQLSHDLLVSGRRIRLFHASAQSPHVRVWAEHTDEEFDGMFRATEMTGDGPEPTVVGYGDLHDTYIRSRRGRTIFNVGSVGNPLDEPTPSYAIVEGAVGAEKPAPLNVSFVRVPYDVDAEVAVAFERGMPQADVWAVELRTGVYRRFQTHTP